MSKRGSIVVYWERDNIRYGSACAEIRIRKYGRSLSFTPLVLDTSLKVNRGTYDVKRKRLHQDTKIAVMY